MINDQASFETALQRMADLLDHAGHGDEEQLEFKQLMHDIEAFQPTALSAPPDSNFARLGKEAEALFARSQDFKHRLEEREQREKWSSFPEDGQGVGPTTGV